MLKEYLLETSSEQAVWSESMPGIQVCRFSFQEGANDKLRAIPVRGDAFHFETFFCLSGRMVVKPHQDIPRIVEAPSIFLLSDVFSLGSCLCSGNLGGILVTSDSATAKEALATVCSTFGIELILRSKQLARAGSFPPMRLPPNLSARSPEIWMTC